MLGYVIMDLDYTAKTLPKRDENKANCNEEYTKQRMGDNLRFHFGFSKSTQLRLILQMDPVFMCRSYETTHTEMV